MATWKDVGRIAGRLPETTEASPRNWRVRKKLMFWERPLRKADYTALVTEAWLAQAPKTVAKAFLARER